MKTIVIFTAFVLAAPVVFAQHIRVGVLGLFHPDQITLSVPIGHAVVLHTRERSLVLEKSSGQDAVRAQLSGNEVVLDFGHLVVHTPDLTVTGRDNGPVDFLLAVPGKISRHYYGTLSVTPISEELMTVVTMDLETAVASVVAAENTPGTPLEALKAQAVAIRSYFIAGNRGHHGFDFCDTTHCQFLRGPTVPGSLAAIATSSSRGLILNYRFQPFAAMYSRSCSGRTHTPEELGLHVSGYPYFAVECKYCREHPSHWQSRISGEHVAALHTANEASRLHIDRHLGWSAVPSNDFSMHREEDHVILQGTGQGHGIGLCQAGARAMAREGADFRQILAHYYPNTTVIDFKRLAAVLP